MSKPWEKMSLREKKDLFNEWVHLYMEVNDLNGHGFKEAFQGFRNTHPQWVEDIQRDEDLYGDEDDY